MSSTPPPDKPEEQPQTQTPNQPPVYQDWRSMRDEARAARRAQRDAWRQQRRAWRGSWGWGSSGWGDWGWPRGRWIGGAVLILLGVIFLLQNVTALAFNNWWALFLLIPAMIAFASAWTMYSVAGRLTWLARQALIGGIFLTAVTVAFLLNLNWGLVLPILLILGGLSLLLNVMLPG